MLYFGYRTLYISAKVTKICWKHFQKHRQEKTQNILVVVTFSFVLFNSKIYWTFQFVSLHSKMYWTFHICFFIAAKLYFFFFTKVFVKLTSVLANNKSVVKNYIEYQVCSKLSKICSFSIGEGVFKDMATFWCKHFPYIYKVLKIKMLAKTNILIP